MSNFIREQDLRAARENRDLAMAYIQNARQLDPAKYPREAEYRRQFIERARELWHSYLFYRKAAMQ
jgi:hypothetical protein